MGQLGTAGSAERAVRTVGRRIRNAAASVRNPPWVPPGHYYSPIPDRADISRALATSTRTAEIPGVDLREDDQVALARELGPAWREFAAAGHQRRYHPDNVMFGMADAAVLHGMLRHRAPSRIVEVGSGFSSAVMLDTFDTHLPAARATFVEPYPDRLLGLIDPADLGSRHTLLRAPVQDVPLALFDELAADDILFIDSTHVSKAGSDVNWLFFHVLPRLAPGVVVHLHDIHWPFEYDERWVREGRAWTELYLLRAFLTFNAAFEILLFSSWLWSERPDVVADELPATAGHRPGSIWLRRTC